MTGKLKSLLQEYRRSVEAITGEHLQKIVLYGSCARGDNNPDSDIDIMILVDLDAEALRKCESRICDATYDFNYDHDTEIMPIVQNTKHFDYWKNAYMFYWNVEHEGVAI